MPKQYLWLPYLSEYKIKGKKIRFIFKGGKLEISISDIHSIMLYGKHIPLSQDFLEILTKYNIPIIIHRRNMAKAVFIMSNVTTNKDDLLTYQILYRKNRKKTIHISRRLLKMKFRSMSWLVPPPYENLFKVVDIDRLRNIESQHALRYWKKYYELLNINGSRRDRGNYLSQILDASSKFVSSIILRWILYHKLSPYHGFLHTPTDYPALVYDFFEPYRGYIDKIVFEVVRSNKKKYDTQEQLLSWVIEEIKDFMDTRVYVHSTKQIVTFHELLHGIVLAFRAYLLKLSSRFIIPYPAIPKGGRPVKAGFKLYGHKAGVTDYFDTAKEISIKFFEEYKPKFTRIIE